MAPLRPLNHWMLHDDRLAVEFDATLNLTPWYDPVRLVQGDIDLTFFAPLTTDINSRVGGISGSFSRNSQGSYRAPMGASLAIAPDDMPRHEYTPQGLPFGLLFEPAKTNKCTNFNANPDEALSNMTPAGPGVLSRVQDPAILAASGLSNLCTSGFVFKADNSAGGANFAVYSEGAVGNLNRHACSVYARKDPASADGTFLQLQGTPVQEFTNEDIYELVSLTEIPAITSARLAILCGPGSIAYFVLNQLEEAPYDSSVILTEGASTSRSRDFLTWPDLNAASEKWINESEGMVAFLWRPGYGPLAASTMNGNAFILSSGDSRIYFNPIAAGTDRFAFVLPGSPGSVINLDSPVVARQTYLVMARWKTGENIQVGYKTLGVNYWGGLANPAGFTTDTLVEIAGNSSPLMDAFHIENLYCWKVDRGIDWLEDFFSDVANT